MTKTREQDAICTTVRAATYQRGSLRGDLPDDAVIVASDECEFEQMQPHEWYCVVHDVTKIAGTTEPVRCDHDN